MLGRAILIVTLLLGAGLAGCIGAPEEPPAEVPNQNTADSDVLDANESTVAPDGRGEISAFKETNKTETGTGGMMHAHDYWGGETRKVLYQDDLGLIPLPLIPEGKAPGTAIADFDLPEPYLVYEGTDHLEILFTEVRPWPTPKGAVAHPAISIYVDYLTAADEPGNFRPAGKVTPDQPLIIPVKPTEADMPHSTKSLWVFRIYTGEANAWSFNFTVTAVKGNTVVDWPPHPNLYADKTERVVLEGEFKTTTKGTAEFYLTGADANWVYPDRVISYGTERIEVDVEIVGIDFPVAPNFYYLDYKNASYITKLGNGDSAGGRLRDTESDGMTMHFVIPVDAQGMDTPYGQKSRWGFRMLARFGEEGSCPGGDFEQQMLGGCQVFPYTLTYRMKVTAYGHSTAGELPPDPNAPPTPPTA